MNRFLTSSGHPWTGSHRACAQSSCLVDCCAFPQDRKGYFIILQPGELNFVRHLGASIRHLKIIDDNFFGGQKAVCIATNKLCCDLGWKPYDCRTHPVFPCVGEDGAFYYKYDPHCRAFQHELFGWHLTDVARLISGQFIENPSLIDFYRACLQDEDDLSPPQPFHKLTYFMQKQASAIARYGSSLTSPL